MTSLAKPSRLVLTLAVLAAVPSLVRAQQPATPPASAPTAPKPARRTVEIRAQAPAPEVITVRPREVPQYSRRLLVPSLLTYADTAGVPRPSVVVPAPASAEARAAATDRRTRTP